MLITSRTNPAVSAAAALRDKKHRDEKKMFLLDGIKLFEEAVKAGLDIVSVFATEKNLPLCRKLLPVREITEVTEPVFDRLSAEKSPQGVICVAKYIDKIHNINKIYKVDDFRDGGRYLMLSSLRDPGNLGTVIRTAAAFGIDGLILSSDCADIYNPKTVRAAMGTLFRMPAAYVRDAVQTVSVLGEAGYSVCAAVLDPESRRLDRMNVTDKTVFVIGNEGHGIDPAIVSAAHEKVYIPMEEGVESLNASAAAAVFMWQMRLSSGK